MLSIITLKSEDLRPNIKGSVMVETKNGHKLINGSAPIEFKYSKYKLKFSPIKPIPPPNRIKKRPHITTKLI